jgi:hypothetical protein
MPHNAFHATPGLLSPPRPAQQAASVDDDDYWADVLSNAGPSTVQLLKDLIQPFVHPIETFEGLKSLATDAETQAAVGEYLSDQYGSIDAIQASFRENPVGVASDVLGMISLVSPAAGFGAARLTGKAATMAGKVADISRTVGKLDPAFQAVNLPVQGVRLPFSNLQTPNIRSALPAITGVTTGVGTGTAARALETGLEGGARGTAFRTGIRGSSDVTDLVNRLRSELDRIGSRRRAKYKQQKSQLANSVVDPSEIRNVIDNLRAERLAGGGPDAGDKILARLKQIEDLLDDRVARGDNTVVGMDTLKQNIRDLSSRNMGEIDPASAITMRIADSIGEEIGKVDARYIEMMKDYELAKALETELRTAFASRNNNVAQQAMKRLMQATRENVNSDMGGLADMLEGIDPLLLDEVSGRAMNPLAPVGIQRTVAGGLFGGALGYDPGRLPRMLPSMAMTSPRLVGETLHGIGRTTSAVAPVVPAGIRAARQAGIASQIPYAPGQNPRQEQGLTRQPIMPGGPTSGATYDDLVVSPELQDLLEEWKRSNSDVRRR